MSLSETTARKDYVGNASTTVFAYTWRITDKAHLEVLVDGVVQVLDTDYTVSGVDAAGGGSVTFTTAPADQTVVTILRKQPLSQLSDYVLNEAHPSDRIERDLDKVVMRLQQDAETLTRALRAPKGDALDMVLPSVASRKSRVLGFTATGAPTAVALDAAGGDVSLATVLATGSTVARSLAERAADVAHPFDYIPANQHAAILNGTTTYDATADLQAMFDDALLCQFPSGTFLIDAVAPNNEGGSGGIAPRSGSRLLLGPTTVLKAITNASDWYTILRVYNVSNVHIVGGLLQGERSTHTGVTGEFGYGLGVWSSSDVWVFGTRAIDCWGDGFFVSSSNNLGHVASDGIHLLHCHADNNRRQGLSVLRCTDLWVVGGHYNGSNGTAPEAGIDIEPGAAGGCIGFHLIGVVTDGNAGSGLILQGATNSVTDGAVIGHRARSNGVSGISVTGANVKDVALTGCVGRLNTFNGLRVENGPSFISVVGGAFSDNQQHGVFIDAVDSVFSGFTARANGQQTDNTYDNVILGTAAARNVVTGITARHGGGLVQPRYGINVTSGMEDNMVVNNDLLNAGKTADLRPGGGTRTVQRGNRLSAIPTFADGDTTPAVDGGDVFKTANGSAGTTITTFDNGHAGQVITILFTDANTTIAETGNIKLSAAFTSSADDTMRLLFDGTNWYELSRSVN